MWAEKWVLAISSRHPTELPLGENKFPSAINSHLADDEKGSERRVIRFF